MADDDLVEKSDLTPQEIRLIACAAKGASWEPEPVDGETPDMNASGEANWHENRTLRAEVLRCLLIGDIWPGHVAPWHIDPHGVRINGASINGKFSLRGAVLDRALFLFRCRFDARPDLGRAETRTLSFAGSHLPHGIGANSVIVKGALHLRDGFKAGNEVNLIRATIDGQFDCENGSFENAGGKALSLDAAIIGADVFLHSGFKALGAVSLIRATINGQLACTKGNFQNPGNTALDLDSVTVGADVFLDGGLNAVGKVDLIGAKIDGDLRIRNSSFANPDGDAINLTLAEIGAGLFLTGLRAKSGSGPGLVGRLRLDQARCRTFCDDRQSWPENGKLTLDGFVYERFDNSEIGWRTRREWLERQDPEHLGKRFRPQPWTQAIAVLRAMGHDDDARELGLRREIARARSSSVGFFGTLWLYLLRAIVGNGYKPWRAVGWSAAFLLIGWFVFSAAAMQGYIAPRDGNVRVSDGWKKNHAL
ncbi:MAG TPA: hypothetical protein VII35_16745, partial [Steroidobacteraceae bacterium]